MDIIINIGAIIHHDPPGVMGNYESPFQPIKAADTITNWLPVYQWDDALTSVHTYICTFMHRFRRNLSLSASHNVMELYL